jgi:hypothetical protein
MTEEEAARFGYDTAIRLADKLARTVWSIYAALIPTNAFLVTIIGLLITRRTNWLWAAALVALAGLWVCFVWHRTTARTFAYYGFYFAWARDLEGRAFGDTVKIVRDGESFGGSHGRSRILVDSSGDPLEMPFSARQFKVRTLVTSIIVTFAALYLSGLIVICRMTFRTLCH